MRERVDYQSQLEQVREELQPRIDGNLLACRTVLLRLQVIHQQVIEQSDIDLNASTRWVALWELSGRCLALGSALVEQVRTGFGPESVGTMRVIHEACNLLHAIADDDSGDLTRRWLAGETIMQRALADHLDELEGEAIAIIDALGMQLDVDLVAGNREIYHRLSQPAHNARPGFADSIARPLRLFAYGPHPDIRANTVYVEMTGVLVESCLIAAGHALTAIIGGSFYTDAVIPLIEERQTIEKTMPVDANVRAHYGWHGAP